MAQRAGVTAVETPAPTEAEAGLSKAERAYRWIKDRIHGTCTEQVFPPGQRLVLSTLADRLGMSVVPVREAIRQLEAEGLVTFERNVGARVAMRDAAAYSASMQTLGLLEGAATAVAAEHLTAEDLDRARGINDRMARLLEDFEPAEFTRLNHEFHRVLFDRCPNPRLIELVEAEWERLGHLRESTFSFVPERARDSVAEHEQLLGLLESDAAPERIEAVARAHRAATLGSYLARQHQPSSTTT